jgi:hypothetical protein
MQKKFCILRLTGTIRNYRTWYITFNPSMPAFIMIAYRALANRNTKDLQDSDAKYNDIQ